MENLSQLPQALIEELKRSPYLGEIRWFTAFPSANRPIPLTGVWGSVELSKVTMERGQYSGYSGGEEVFACPVTVELEVNLLCAPKGEANRLREAFGLLCDQLMLRPGSLGVTQVNCGGIEYDSQAMGLRLKATVSLSPLAIRRDQPVQLDSLKFIVNQGV